MKKQEVREFLLRREKEWDDCTSPSKKKEKDYEDSRLVQGARRIYGTKTPIEKAVVTASPTYPLGDNTPFLPVLWTKKDVATRVQNRNEATRTLKSVSLKPTARTLSELKKRIRSSTYEMNAVPSIKTAVARASRDVRELKQSLNRPSDVTTSKRFQKSLSRTCRVAAEASSSVHDLNILVEVQERKLREEYERAVRRLDGERAMMMSEVVEPAQRKLHELRRKIDTYEGLESCPLVGRMQNVEDIELIKRTAWHCVARAHGWIPESERKKREQSQDTNKNKKKRKKERRISRYMMSTSSSRSTRHRRATFNEKKLAEAILNSTELDQNIQVSLHYDKAKRREASGNAARAALSAVPHALKYKRLAELAISCDERFEDLTQRYQDAHSVVRDAQVVFNEEKSRGASDHLTRRDRLRHRKIEIRHTRLEVYRNELKRILGELRGRWDGLGTCRNLLSAIRDAQNAIKRFEKALLKEESPDPTTEVICSDEIQRLNKEADLCGVVVSRVSEVYVCESKRFSSDGGEDC